MKVGAGEECLDEELWQHPPRDREPDRFAHVRGAPDPRALVGRAVADLKTALKREYQEHQELLEPFVETVDTLAQLAFDGVEAPEGDGEAARALVAAVEQLEDLLEALAATRIR
ncbi:MAG: hypothetical protein AAFU79_13470 [Myxococcota bacterium]